MTGLRGQEKFRTLTLALPTWVKNSGQVSDELLMLVQVWLNVISSGSISIILTAADYLFKNRYLSKAISRNVKLNIKLFS